MIKMVHGWFQSLFVLYSYHIWLRFSVAGSLIKHAFILEGYICRSLIYLKLSISESNQLFVSSAGVGFFWVVVLSVTSRRSMDVNSIPHTQQASLDSHNGHQAAMRKTQSLPGLQRAFGELRYGSDMGFNRHF